MYGFQWFILFILLMVALVGCHRRYIRYLIIRVLREENTSAEDIERILKAYAGETKW
jgi:hypothetical protein